LNLRRFCIFWVDLNFVKLTIWGDIKGKRLIQEQKSPDIEM
jgi:hypothetical protein